MKKILNLLGIITLIAVSTNSLVACNTQEYTKEQLDALKKERNIKIKTSNDKDGILEWITPQEKKFNQVDNKWYFVVWRCKKKWRLNNY